MHDRRLTRRRLLQVWAVGGGSVLLAACSGQPASAPGAQTAVALGPTAAPTTASTSAPTAPPATPAPTTPPQPTTVPTAPATAQPASNQTITAMAQAATVFLSGLNE
jgi:hypothetical protein